MSGVEGWTWRGERVPAAWLLSRYRVRIDDRPGPWRVVALREVHGRPLLRARFVGEAPSGVLWRSVGGLAIESPVDGGQAELPVNSGSAYDPAHGPGPWSVEPVGGGQAVHGLGLALGLADGPPAEADNRYQTLEVTWRRADAPSSSGAPAAGVLLLGWELPNRPAVHPEEWRRFDALGATIAKIRPYHVLDPADGERTLDGLVRRGVRVAIRPDADGDFERDWAATVQRLSAAAKRLLAAGAPPPVVLIPDSEPNLHGRPVPSCYFERLELARSALAVLFGERARLVSPPFAAAQGEEGWHAAGRPVISRFDAIGVHAYGQGDLSVALRFLAFDYGKPFFVAEAGDSSDGISAEERVARTARLLRRLAATGRVEACCLFILGTADPRWEPFVLPAEGLAPLREAVRGEWKEETVIPEEIRAQIARLCERYGVDPYIIAAMCWIESGFRPDAVGDDGHSVGLLQLHDEGLGFGMSVEERKNPERNLEVGIRAHRAYRDEFGSVEAAIAAHNAGGPALRRVKGDWQALFGGRVAERYVRPVLAKAAEYRAANLFPPSPVRVQLDAIWGVSEALLGEGRNAQAWQLRAAVIALKDELGLT
ncbi:MAG: transglycosylase SLT domain-containing protein [Chloroflexota bacterium]|nr:transglycosylase SLT domain-containing protein [Dehalococcoidia bacterium]MDW8252481.1 transglycosylase SLT domain-containing protein [Chloroflexota bacterium]